MSATQEIQITPKLAEILRTSGRTTDPDKKPERMVEFAAQSMQDYAADRREYFRIFDEMVTPETKTKPEGLAEAIRPYAPAARWFDENRRNLAHYARRMQQMFGEAITVEWLTVLSERYPDADVLRNAGYAA